MATSFTKDFTGCMMLIYDAEGNQLASTKIWSHDVKHDDIDVVPMPVLELDVHYDLLILASPVPYAYKGKVHRIASDTTLRLYRGKEAENRRDVRYKVTFPATIESLVYDDVAHETHTPVEVTLKNLSKGGMCFYGRFNTLMNGDTFRIRLTIGDNDKLLTALVVHRTDEERVSSEFGCKLLEKHE